MKTITNKQNIPLKVIGVVVRFLLVASVINDPIEIVGLNLNSNQADKQILQVLKLAGVEIITNLEKNSITLSSRFRLIVLHFDATDCPDLFPPIAALAAFCEGIVTLKVSIA